MWNYATGEMKGEYREHTHVVEAVCWAPLASHEAINELATGEVCWHPRCSFAVNVSTYELRPDSPQINSLKFHTS